VTNLENAIAELKYTKKFYSSQNSFDLAIEALEKQIPKKMIYASENKDYKCPNCKSRYDNPQNDGILCCAICGQKIDWSGEE
jgi:hypothetical protein